jgi:hypothetical protein
MPLEVAKGTANAHRFHHRRSTLPRRPTAMIHMSQLRTQLERTFSPLACECNITGDHSLTIKLYHPVSGQVDLVVSGLNLTMLQTPESIAALIEELRYELESNSLQRPDPVV